MDLEVTKTNAEEQKRRQENDRMDRNREREQLERKRLEKEHERLERERAKEQQDLKWDAICRMQVVDSDLSPDDQVTLVDLFNQEHDSTRTYLALKSDTVRKTWIKRKLAQAESN